MMMIIIIISAVKTLKVISIFGLLHITNAMFEGRDEDTKVCYILACSSSPVDRRPSSAHTGANYVVAETTYGNILRFSFLRLNRSDNNLRVSKEKALFPHS
jgi:hypothetical protein